MIKKSRGAPKKQITANKRLDIRVTDLQHKKWLKAALKSGVSLSSWLKSLADKNI